MKKIAQALLLSCPTFVFSNINSAEACTPVVYLFRHAEDVSNGTGLTAVGEQHAALYPSMVAQYQLRYNICRVNRVYAMYDKNADSSPGTTNPFNTAKYLAANVGGVQMDVLRADGKRYHLYEKIDSSPDGGLAATGEAAYPNSRLFYAMQGVLNHQGSVAIFWTQQGMPDVSRALGVTPVYYPTPGNPLPDGDPAFSWPGRLRASVNIFRWSGVSYSAEYTPFPTAPPVPLQQEVKPRQCFDFNGSKIVRGIYYCTFSGNIQTNGQPTVPTSMIAQIKGKFCVRISALFSNGYAFGTCE
jgi:hypothetical protein